MSQTSTTIQVPAQLSRDETRVLEECKHESLMYRSIPLGLGAYFGLQYSMSKNIISTRGKWFKIAGVLIAGYIIGKISYTSTCRKKILTQIPNSSLAQLIRGVEAHQITEIDVNLQPQSDNHPVSADVNQYGDPVYKTNK
ncbi:unnamed protein product [Adineta steineri]|uniref:OCIA domain-containing protein n=1 Tax=Adineta steineri TaxID=433720 RepID=A0A814RR28_9BILA|nr:unnamed protein product [Adineta steineri]CAF1285806.1 unnamed protein product [Adineta steineri]